MSTQAKNQKAPATTTAAAPAKQAPAPAKVAAKPKTAEKPAAEVKPARAISETEKQVRAAYQEIESTSADLKGQLKEVRILEARDFEASIRGKARKVILVVIPFPDLKNLTKIHKKLVPELEKRLKVPVLITAKRTIQSKWLKPHKSQIRPRSRTLTAVHDAILEDLIAPANIIGRRIRVRTDGSRLHKISLDQSDEDFLKDKVEIIQNIYKRLTNKDIVIEFKADPVYHTIRKA